MEHSIDGLLSDSSTEEIQQDNIQSKELSDAEVDNRVIVVGGGLGGLATACTLAARGYGVVLCDKMTGQAARLQFMRRLAFGSTWARQS